MAEVPCEACGKQFHTIPCKLKVGRGRFCSVSCRSQIRLWSKHGDYKTKLYQAWQAMKARCEGSARTEANKSYRDRGISVCQEWRSSYVCFRDWALSSGYQDGLQLDRKDPFGNYEPTNCRWATPLDQQRNKPKRGDSHYTSKFKGVSRSKTTKTPRWHAFVSTRGKTTYLGSFLSEEDAARAYDAAALKMFGEFAYTNFKKDGGIR